MRNALAPVAAHEVPPVSGWTGDRPLGSLAWGELPALALSLADGGGAPEQPTAVRVGWDPAALYVRFDCRDRDAWGIYGNRDDPIYREEAVEIFLAPGEADPARYVEIEVSPRGTVFDALIENPDADRATLRADPTWDCPGLRWEVGAGESAQDWWAALAIPWPAVAPGGAPPRLWRANFFRIERPRDGVPELTCWSPTLTRPADFHKPARFGLLRLSR